MNNDTSAESDTGTTDAIGGPGKLLRVGKWRFRLPQSRALRMLIGVAFILGGLVGFLPIVGFWMIPVGLLILSHDIGRVRRWRRRLTLRFSGRRNKAGL